MATIQIIQERSAQIIFLKLGDVLFNLTSSQQIMASYYNKQMTKYSVIQMAYSVIPCLVVGKDDILASSGSVQQYRESENKSNALVAM